MGYRKTILVNGGFYHVFNKSIAEFTIFRFLGEYLRMREVLRFYRTALPGKNFSTAEKLDKLDVSDFHGPQRVRILAYCLMPTHIHLFLEQKARDGISEFMRFISNSYACYFNAKTRRKGPLWESRFKAKPVTECDHALHLSRYIHLNPTSAGLVTRPEDWEFSSYHEYLHGPNGDPLCNFKGIHAFAPDLYRKFVEDHKDYQRSLQIIKNCFLD